MPCSFFARASDSRAAPLRLRRRPPCAHGPWRDRVRWPAPARDRSGGCGDRAVAVLAQQAMLAQPSPPARPPARPGPEHRRQGPTAPENTSERRTKPEPSSTSPRVKSGQSALLLGMAGLGLARRRALEEGVGQVVERHRGAQPEQIRRSNSCASAARCRRHGTAGSCARNPPPAARRAPNARTASARTGALRARRRHAGDHGGHGERGGGSRSSSLQAEPHPQPDMHADRTPDQLQRADIGRSGRPVPPDGALLSAARRCTSSGQQRNQLGGGRAAARRGRTARPSDGVRGSRSPSMRWRTFSPLRSERTRRCNNRPRRGRRFWFWCAG